MNQAQPRKVATSLPLRFSFLQFSFLLALGLIIGAWVFVLSRDSVQQHSFFSGETVRRGGNFIKDLFGIGSPLTPAFQKGTEWERTGRLAYQTLITSILAAAIAGAIALATFMFAASNVMIGELAPRAPLLWRALFFITRAFFILTRGIPELVWAMVVIFLLNPGILPAAVALGIHNAGILGKLAAEIVEGMDTRPLRNLQSSGAGKFQALLYGVLPEALPQFLTLLAYRWEVIIRTTIIVGFVAAGGLGTEFRLAMAQAKYTTVALLVMWNLILVVNVDIAAAGLRRLAKQ